MATAMCRMSQMDHSFWEEHTSIWIRTQLWQEALKTGVSIAMYGGPNNPPNGSFQAIIDDMDPASVSFADAAFADVYLFYASSLLDNTLHKIVFRNFPEVHIDFALVGVENNTPLLEHSVIVGSDDPSIQYQGAWSRNSSTLRIGNSTRTPFGNSTAQNSDGNASFQFQFYGTFVSVVGVSPDKPFRTVWSFDGQIHAVEHLAEFNTRFEWFSKSSAFPENHTLEFQGTDDVAVLFTLEYIIYTPSRSTLESQANDTVIVPGSISSPSAGGSNPTVTVTPASVSITTHRLSSAGITGVVIGAVAGVSAALLVLILVVRMKRQAKFAKVGSIEQGRFLDGRSYNSY
ncbi:hypothetical protein DXG01_012207 [Tephrocybe rancida]|nr:hypothetical protein DXG01_012207 [Tephrocybe rancida]